MTETPGQPETPPPYEPPGSGQPVPPAAPPPMPYAGAAPPPVAPRNGLGTTALILGIVALLFCWSVFGGIVLGILAVIFGILGRGRVRRGEATNGGVAIGGIVLGALAIVAGAVFIAIYVFAFNWFKDNGGQDYMDCMNKAGNDTSAQQKCSDEFQHHLETKLSITLTETPAP